MPVIVQDEVFDLLPSPSWGTPQKRKAPKIKFQSANGYVHQRERYSHPRMAYSLKWPLLTEAEKNTLENWLDSVKSATFWLVPPTGLWSGLSAVSVKLCRLTDDEITFTPLSYGYWAVDINVEEV